MSLEESRLSCLDHVLRSAACLIGRIQKYDHVTRYMLDVLHWPPVRQRIEYRVVSLVWRCQLGLAPTYLIDLCWAVSGVWGSRSLRFAERRSWWSHIQRIGRTPRSLWWALGFGMISLRSSACSLDYVLIHF